MSIKVNLLIASKFGGCLLFFGGPVEDRRNNRRLATVTGGCLLFFLLYSPNLVAVSFPLLNNNSSSAVYRPSSEQ